MASFDVHQHLWPPQLVEALRRRRTPPRLHGDALELEEGRFPADLQVHRLDDRLKLLERDGIETAIVSLQPTLDLDAAPELADAYHEGVLELVAASDGRLRAFAAAACLNGFAGACIPARRLVAGLGALADELAHAGQTLFVHPGPSPPAPAGAPPWWTPVVDYTNQMQAAYAAWLAEGVTRHPALPVVFAILGGGAPFQLERLRSRSGRPWPVPPTVFLETSSYGRRALQLSLEAHGRTQLLYGSDVPVADSRPTLAALDELGEEVRRAVLVDNPTRLFQ
jgi:predicted TIM-barrel fold metal-dependent hydrolase